jgi:hypothetical protein
MGLTDETIECELRNSLVKGGPTYRAVLELT